MVKPHRQGRARPYGALAPRRHFAGQGEWAPTSGVLMTVDMTSYDDDHASACPYAAAGIPLRVLTDHRSGTFAVNTEELKNYTG